MSRRGQTRPGRRHAARRGRLWRGLLIWPSLLAACLLLASVLPVLALRWIDPPGSAFMLLRAWELRGSAQAIDWRWVPSQSISPWLALAVLAAEDQRFPQHRGFDTVEIERALAAHRAGGRLRGASTISQQLARNLFLWPGRSWIRKALEAWFTVLIETALPKARILELHLNLAEFGDGIYGAEAAAQLWFGQPASRLTLDQAARLAVVLPSPRRSDPRQLSPAQQRRAEWVQRQIEQLGGPQLLRQIGFEAAPWPPAPRSPALARLGAATPALARSRSAPALGADQSARMAR